MSLLGVVSVCVQPALLTSSLARTQTLQLTADVLSSSLSALFSLPSSLLCYRVSTSPSGSCFVLPSYFLLCCRPKRSPFHLLKYKRTDAAVHCLVTI